MNAIPKAIELLRDIGSDYADKVASDLEALLKQEPVAWMTDKDDPTLDKSRAEKWRSYGWMVIELYAGPAPAEPVNARLLEAANQIMTQIPTPSYTGKPDGYAKAYVDLQEAIAAAEQATPAPELTMEQIKRHWSGGACPHWAVEFARSVIKADRELRGEGK